MNTNKHLSQEQIDALLEVKTKKKLASQIEIEQIKNALQYIHNSEEYPKDQKDLINQLLIKINTEPLVIYSKDNGYAEIVINGTEKEYRESYWIKYK